MEPPREAEVAQLEHAVPAQQQVFWLDVAVHGAELVQVLQRPKQLPQDGLDLVERKAGRAALQLVQDGAVHVVEHLQAASPGR